MVLQEMVGGTDTCQIRRGALAGKRGKARVRQWWMGIE